MEKKSTTPNPIRIIKTVLLFLWVPLFLFSAVLWMHNDIESIPIAQHITLSVSPDIPKENDRSPAMSSDEFEIVPLKGMTIILDAGHGGKDPGCVSRTSPKIYESDINLAVVMATKDALEAQGATVILTREDDSWLGIYSRAAITNLYCLNYAREYGYPSIDADLEATLTEEFNDVLSINTDSVLSGGMGPMVGTGFSDEMQALLAMEYDLPNIIFISIHTNTSSSSRPHGTQVYYVTDDSMIRSEKNMVRTRSEYRLPQSPQRDPYYGRDGETNAFLATLLHDAIVSEEPRLATNQQDTVTDNFCVLREHGIPSAMIELGYISNADDRALLTDPEVQESIALGISNAVIAFYQN